MTDEQLSAAVQEGITAGVAAVAHAVRGGVTGDRATQVNVRPAPRQHPFAVAGLAVALLVPLGGWVMSLSNRVAVLESQSTTLQSAAVEIAAMKQQIADFRQEFDEWKSTESRNAESSKDRK